LPPRALHAHRGAGASRLRTEPLEEIAEGAVHRQARIAVEET